MIACFYLTACNRQVDTEEKTQIQEAYLTPQLQETEDDGHVTKAYSPQSEPEQEETAGLGFCPPWEWRTKEANHSAGAGAVFHDLAIWLPPGYTFEPSKSGGLEIIKSFAEDSLEEHRLVIDKVPVLPSESRMEQYAGLMNLGKEVVGQWNDESNSLTILMEEGNRGVYRYHSGYWSGFQEIYLLRTENGIYRIQEFTLLPYDHKEELFSEFLKKGYVSMDKGQTVIMPDKEDWNVQVFRWDEVLDLYLERWTDGKEQSVNCFLSPDLSEPTSWFCLPAKPEMLFLQNDINFDGYKDLAVNIGDQMLLYLWDPKLQGFDTTKDYGGILKSSVRQGYILDSVTKLIKTYETGNRGDDNEQKNALLKWEDGSLKLLRTYRHPPVDQWEDERQVLIEDFGDGLLITGHDQLWEHSKGAGSILHQGIYSYLDYVKEKDRLEELFAGPYGFTNDYARDTADPVSEYAKIEKPAGIPADFLEVLELALYAGNEKEILSAMTHDKLLTNAQVKLLARENTDIYRWLDEAMAGNSIFVQTDGDNDGIEDICAEIYGGGSGGFTSFVFWKGQNDGTYVQTGYDGHILEEFSFLQWQGKNYLCRTNYDYNSKLYSGLSIYLYEEGVCREQAILALMPGQVQFDAEVSPGYEELAQTIMDRGATYYLDLEEGMGARYLVGSGEREGEEGTLFADLDNSGVETAYQKSIWYPSNRYTTSYLNCEPWWQYCDKYQLKEKDDDVQMLWVESYEGRSVVCVISRLNRMQYMIHGYEFSPEEVKAAFQIALEAEPEVRKNYYRRSEN